jgi:hypothetical protein
MICPERAFSRILTISEAPTRATGSHKAKGLSVSLQTHVAGNNRASVRRDARGRYLPGVTGNVQGSRIGREKVLAKFAELRSVYDPEGKLSVLDLNRLELAAKHLLIAAKARNPNTSVRSLNAAERVLSMIARPAAKPLPVGIKDLRIGGAR